MPRTARLDLTEEALTQIHIALEARIEALEQVDDITEARRAV